MSLDALASFARDVEGISVGARWIPPDCAQTPLRPRAAREVEIEPTRRPAPALEYPEPLRRRGRTGSAWVSFVIRSDGTVERERFRVIHADEPDFGVAAVRSLARSVYEPAIADGVAVPVRMVQTVSFNIAR